MLSSTRQAIACTLLIVGVAVSAHSQNPPAVRDPPATITGKVTAKGKGLAGIVVGMYRTNSPRPDPNRIRTVTDQDGNYRITNVPAGSFEIMPVAPGYVALDFEGRKSLIVNKGETIENIDFALARGGVITGKVTDADGRPVIEEPIFVVPVTPTPTQYGYMPARGATDDRGIYRIYGLAQGQYRVAAGQDNSGFFGHMQSLYKRAYHPDVADFAQAAIIELAEGGEATNVDITLGRPGTTYTASGRIVDGDTGKPIANVPYGMMQFLKENYTSSSFSGLVSNSQGEFRLQGLTPGKYAVFVSSQANATWRAEAVRFEVIDQDVTGLQIKTTKSGASVSGVVVVEGADDKTVQAMLSKTELHAQVLKERGDDSAPSVTLNPDGSFRFMSLPPGLTMFYLSSRSRELYIARVERDGVVQRGGIDLKDGEQVTGVRIVVAYGNATLRGVIKFENGSPPPGDRLYVNLVRVLEDANAISVSSNGQPRVDARGQFLAEGLMPGTYEITVGVFIPNSPNTSFAKQQVTVTAGSVTEVTIKLDLSDTPRRP